MAQQVLGPFAPTSPCCWRTGQDRAALSPTKPTGFFCFALIDVGSAVRQTGQYNINNSRCSWAWSCATKRCQRPVLKSTATSSPWEAMGQMWTHSTPADAILQCSRRTERLKQVAWRDSVGDQWYQANSALPLPSLVQEAQDTQVGSQSRIKHSCVILNQKAARAPFFVTWPCFYSGPFVGFLRRFKTKKCSLNFLFPLALLHLI